MELMNGVFQPYLNFFVIVFIDDFLVYSKSEAYHVQHLRVFLQRLSDEKLYAKFSKCGILLSSMAFLGYLVSNEGIMVYSVKVEAVQD